MTGNDTYTFVAIAASLQQEHGFYAAMAWHCVHNATGTEVAVCAQRALEVNGFPNYHYVAQPIVNMRIRGRHVGITFGPGTDPYFPWFSPGYYDLGCSEARYRPATNTLVASPCYHRSSFDNALPPIAFPDTYPTSSAFSLEMREYEYVIVGDPLYDNGRGHFFLVRCDDDPGGNLCSTSREDYRAPVRGIGNRFGADVKFIGNVSAYGVSGYLFTVTEEGAVPPGAPAGSAPVGAVYVYFCQPMVDYVPCLPIGPKAYGPAPGSKFGAKGTVAGGYGPDGSTAQTHIYIGASGLDGGLGGILHYTCDATPLCTPDPAVLRPNGLDILADGIGDQVSYSGNILAATTTATPFRTVVFFAFPASGSA